MDITALPFDAAIREYEQQAAELLDGWNAGDCGAIRTVRQKHPRFLDDRIPWLPRNLSEDEVRSIVLDRGDAQLALARWYDFESWPRLVEHVEAAARRGSSVALFESAVDAVVHGDVASLTSQLRERPELVRARSTRVTHFDPPVHRATLLHYVAANGVEGHRQMTPANAVDVARTLLESGADVDSLADMYGGQATTMSMLVSSDHPARAGVQVALVDTLLDFGAAIEGRGAGKWISPLMTALAFGYGRAAEALVRRGARVDTLPAAAALGRVADARRRLANASPEERHRALALSAQHGHLEIVALLLDAGEDPNRYNPDGNHSHSTPLHQAIAAGHADVVRLLVERGAPLDIRDAIYQGTPLGWAVYCDQPVIAAYLRASGAIDSPA